MTDLLAEERVLRDVEDTYVRSHTSTAIDLVALFKPEHELRAQEIGSTIGVFGSTRIRPHEDTKIPADAGGGEDAPVQVRLDAGSLL